MDDQALFGNRIRRLRDSTGHSRETVAESAGINPNYLGEIERGEKWPSLEVIVRIANALAVSPSSFFEYDSEETDPAILLNKIEQLIAKRNSAELQQALRILRSLFP